MLNLGAKRGSNFQNFATVSEFTWINRYFGLSCKQVGEKQFPMSLRSFA